MDSKQITLVAETGNLISEASALGLKPGEWPTVLTIGVRDGEKILFMRKSFSKNAVGELFAVNYLSQEGMILTVLND